MFNVRNSMLPKNHSQTNLGDALSAEDVFTLNSIPNVKLIKKTHGIFSLNDLVLEMSHFLDEEVINRVELEMLSGKEREKWNLPKDFQLIETRNKEIGLVFNELEEVSWRMAGMFDPREIESLKTMFSI